MVANRVAVLRLAGQPGRLPTQAAGTARSAPQQQHDGHDDKDDDYGANDDYGAKPDINWLSLSLWCTSRDLPRISPAQALRTWLPYGSGAFRRQAVRAAQDELITS